jgi:hypothetical protein
VQDEQICEEVESLATKFGFDIFNPMSINDDEQVS